MAKQVSEILIKLGLQGVEGLDKLKGAFRELEKSIGPNNAAIERARQSIIDYGRDSRNTEQVIKGQIDALRGLQSQVERGSSTWAQLATDIEQFRQASRRTDREIEVLRQSILNSASTHNQSRDSVQGHIRSLQALSNQASLTGTTLSNLRRDIANLEQQIEVAEQGSRRFRSALGQALAVNPQSILNQWRAYRQVLQDSASSAEDLATAEQRLRSLSGAPRIEQRRAVSAQAEIVGSAEYQRRFGVGGTALTEQLPDTTAALRQELNELNEDLANLVRGGTDYVTVSNRIAEVQRELRRELTGTADAFERLARAQSATERRGQKVAGIQEYYSTQGPLAPGVGGYRDPATGAMIARGARTPDRIRVDEAAYAQPIGPQAFPEAGRRAQRDIESALDEVNRIYENSKVQRAEIQAKYDQIFLDKVEQGLNMESRLVMEASDKQFKRELDKFDEKMDIADRKRRSRLTAGQAVQAAGAAISGGIFGGPEGFLGGVGGAAIGSAIPGLGTVGGAFAGAAIGAQVGIFRQQIAGTADYAAQIGKLQIALRGIVGSQQAYDQAVQAAASATRELNIPQQEATQGITRLSAAVLGAGGTVTDSAFAFRAMSEAVKATGGGAEQVDGALLALTQVFSKGKVSAEELNQIAERLPGTFTLFAQAAGKTGPELQKALEQGQIGLNDLMKFLTAVRDRYSSTALTVAGSSEEAGARLKIAFDEMRLEVGKALKSTGSDLQVAFAAFVKEITPAVVGAAKGLAASLKLITDNAATFKTLLEFAAALGTATLAINTFKAAATGIAALNIAGTLTTTAGAVKLTGDVMGVTAAKTGLLTGALTSLRVATVALATAWAAPLALTVAIVGAVATYNWIQKLKKATDDLKASTTQRTGESWLSGIGGTAASNAVVNRETSRQLMRVSSLQEKLAALNKEWTALRPLAKNILSPDIAQNAQVELAAVEQRIKTTRLDLYAARRNAEVGLAEIAKRQRQGAERGLTGLTQFAAPAEDTSADRTAKAQESLMRKLQSDFDSTITQLGRRFNAAAKDKLYETLLDYEAKIQRAYKQNNLVLAEDLKLKQKAAALDITEEVLLSEKASLQQKLAEARAKGLDAQAVQNRLDTVNAELKQINYDSTKETTAQLEKQATLATQIKDALTQAFAPTAGGPGRLLTTGVVGGVFPGAFTGEEESFKSLTDQRGIERIKELGKELQALTNPLSQILTAAEAIGSAFSSSFTSVISGTASTQEALASFFNNIANYFLDMAGKIIAKWIEMAILNTVLQLLPSGPKFGSSAAVPGLPGLSGTGALSPGGATSAVTSYAGVKFNALGNAYAANGIVPFAMGGIVNKPTLFRFANGGVPGTGLMGEAGPEAIIPLKRGPDGKLGVSGGGGVSVGEINITVQNSGETLSPAAQKQIANQVQGIVLTTLVNQKRSGGIL
jgi:tape measure domain-containing protein